MALHGKTSKTPNQTKRRHTKPSRAARLNKREAARKMVLREGESALKSLPEAEAACGEAKAAVTAFHSSSEGLTNPTKQQKLEADHSAARLAVSELHLKIQKANELKSRLDLYKAKRDADLLAVAQTYDKAEDAGPSFVGCGAGRGL